jgi:tetratricopeptide (TPR) repeat protein
LNQPAQWKAHIDSAKTSLGAAMDMLCNAEAGLDPALAERAARLQKLLERDDADRHLATNLEKIRMDRSNVFQGKFDFRPALEQYAAAFAKIEPGIQKEEKEVPAAAVAARLNASPIQELLLSAIADWAHVVFRVRQEGLPPEFRKQADLPLRLALVGQQAAPKNEWGDRFRKIDVRNAATLLPELEKLVKEVPISMLPPPVLDLIGDMLFVDPATRLAWFRRAQAQHPTDFWLNFSAGNILLGIDPGDPAEAAGFFRTAIALRPGSTGAYYNLGWSLEQQNKRDEAIAAYRKALDLDGKSAFGFNSLAFALNAKKDFPKAFEAFDKAIELEPTFAMAHRGLGIGLFQSGQFDKAAKSLRKGAELFSEGRWRNDHWRDNCNAFLNECERMQKLEQRLPAVLNGRDVASAGDLREMAELCRQYLKRYPEAVQLYRQAFKAQPGLADDLRGQHRYNAACAAALAGALAAPPSGSDAKEPPKGGATKEDKAALRRQAREWLQADLNAYAKNLKDCKLDEIRFVESRLAQWKTDPDLRGVRHIKALDALPEAEQVEWDALWSKVDQVLKQARAQAR